MTPAPRRIVFPERTGAAEVPALFRAHTSTVRSADGPVQLDLSAVSTLDSAGAGLVAHWRRIAPPTCPVQVVGASASVQAVLDLYGRDPGEAAEAASRPVGAFEALGERGVGAVASLVAFLVVLTDTLWFLPVTLFQKGRKRRALIVEEMVRIGSQSFGIVGVLSLLVGLTMALQAAYQLRQFGANIFLANLVGLSMTREMGPLLTAILLAGRIGSSTAAEIATRSITEELDALRTFGVDPIEYVVVPKFVAISITGPLLSVMATALGIFGGYLVGVLYLDLGHDQFVNQMLGSLYLKDVVTGLVKAVSFSWAIVLIGAYKGLTTRGGPLEVGTATTSSVVVSLFAVIVLDAAYSMIFYFG